LLFANAMRWDRFGSPLCRAWRNREITGYVDGVPGPSTTPEAA